MSGVGYKMALSEQTRDAIQGLPSLNAAVAGESSIIIGAEVHLWEDLEPFLKSLSLIILGNSITCSA